MRASDLYSKINRYQQQYGIMPERLEIPKNAQDDLYVGNQNLPTHTGAAGVVKLIGPTHNGRKYPDEEYCL